MILFSARRVTSENNSTNKLGTFSLADADVDAAFNRI